MFKVLNCHSEAAEWDSYLSMLPYDLHDVHLTTAWARANETPTSSGRLAVWVDEKAGILLCQPFTLREIEGSAGCDMIAFGFGGPFSAATFPSADDGAKFEAAMADYRQAVGCISEFYLLNPMFAGNQWPMLPVRPEPIRMASIMPAIRNPEEIPLLLRRNRASSLAKAGDGVPYAGTVDEFAGHYAAAMERLGAAERWRISRDRFRKYAFHLGDNMLITGVRDGAGATRAMALFLRGHVATYYQFAVRVGEGGSGYADSCVIGGSMLSGKDGARWLYLGGGLESGDTLETYKRSFGGVQRMVYAVKRIHNADEYARLALERPAADEGFFPAYRAEALA